MDALSEIRRSEGIALLVFVQGQKVAAFVDHPRGRGDFAFVGNGGRCFAREAAKFKRKPVNDWVQLEAVENALPKAESQRNPP